jgi:hypothetical protein
MEPEALLVEMRLGPGLVPGLALVPLLLDRDGLPALATGPDADRVFGLLARLSTPLGTSFERRGDESLIRS